MKGFRTSCSFSSPELSLSQGSRIPTAATMIAELCIFQDSTEAAQDYGPLRPCRIRPEPSQIDQHVRFQEFLWRHRHRALRAIAASKQRSDAVRHGPDVERDHQGRRAAGRGHCRAHLVGGAAQYGESPFTGFPQQGIGADWNASFEHRRVERRLGAGEFEIGLAEPVQRTKRIGASLVPGARQRRLELLEAAERHTCHQLIAVAEMPIWRRGADASKARGLRERESCYPLPCNQFQRRADQRLAQISVMIAARRIPLAGVVLAPTHVKSTYIMAAEVSMLSDLR